MLRGHCSFRRAHYCYSSRRGHCSFRPARYCCSFRRGHCYSFRWFRVPPRHRHYFGHVHSFPAGNSLHSPCFQSCAAACWDGELGPAVCWEYCEKVAGNSVWVFVPRQETKRQKRPTSTTIHEQTFHLLIAGSACHYWLVPPVVASIFWSYARRHIMKSSTITIRGCREGAFTGCPRSRKPRIRFRARRLPPITSVVNPSLSEKQPM